MTNNSGKFISVSTVSNMETEMPVKEISNMIPPVPKASFLDTVEEYFGKLWWVWIILIITIKNTRP